MKYCYMVMFGITFPVIAMENDRVKNYEDELGTSFFENRTVLPDSAGRNQSISVFINAFVGNKNHHEVDVEVLKKAISILTPTMFNEIVQSMNNNKKTLERKQLEVMTFLLKQFSMQLDNGVLPNTQQNDVEKMQYRKLVYYTRGAIYCSLFWCTAFLIYYYLFS